MLHISRSINRTSLHVPFKFLAPVLFITNQSVDELSCPGTSDKDASKCRQLFKNGMRSMVARSETVKGDSKQPELCKNNGRPKSARPRAGKERSMFDLPNIDMKKSKQIKFWANNRTSKDAQSNVESEASKCAKALRKVVKPNVAELRTNNREFSKLRLNKLMENPNCTRLLRNGNSPKTPTSKAKNFKPT